LYCVNPDLEVSVPFPFPFPIPFPSSLYLTFLSPSVIVFLS
jgi:hypothetical protein